MTITLLLKRSGIFAILFTGLVLSGYRWPLPQQNFTITLKDEDRPLIPSTFFIASIIDDRDDRSLFSLYTPVSGLVNGQQVKSAVELKGGFLASLKGFADRNVQQNKALRPISISLKSLTVTETILDNRRIQGHIAISMAFYLDRGDDKLHLVNYTGAANYVRKNGPAQDIEPTLRRSVMLGLNYLNTWLTQQAGTNIKLAKGVNVSFTDFSENTEGDTVYYAANRPLTWDDFRAKGTVARVDAEVFVSVGYTERVAIVNGIIHINMAVKVFLPKSACWVRYGSNLDYNLNHEQRHFDIAKLVGEHFKQKIKAEVLPADNYDGPINVEYLESLRELDRLQKLYDGETAHGSNQGAQERWNERIDKELHALGVKK